MSRERDRFVAGVAQDLRQPIAALDRAAQMMAAAGVDPQLVARIVEASARITELTAELVEVGEVQSPQLVRERVDLGTLLYAVIRDLLLIHPGRTLSIQIDGDVVGHWDRPGVTHILQNLLENALAHSRPHDVVRVDCHREGPHVTLRTENPCDDAACQQLGELFRPFRRGDRRPRIGLGLYVARELARAHGGELASSSVDGQIAFVLRLPVAESDSRAAYDPPRRHMRTALPSRLEVVAGERTFWVKGRDISQRGLAFFSDVPLGVGDCVQLSVYSDAASFSLLATVRHCHPLADGAVVGVEFPTELSSAELELLKKPRSIRR